MATTTLSEKWKLAELYMGVPVYKRCPGTGTSGGSWKGGGIASYSRKDIREEIAEMSIATRSVFLAK